MTQTENTQKSTPKKQSNPGQRQQEKLRKLERRRRRRQIWTSIIVAVVVIAVVGIGFWQFQRITSLQDALQQTQHAQQLAKNATSTALVTTPTPSAGPATPPPITGSHPQPTKLADGLEYLDITVGKGTAATTGSAVSVQYTGWLASNGQKFDSSYDHGGQPFTLTIGQHQVIPGWEEGLVGMKPGGTRRLLIPPALGYGAQGSGSTIPPNSTLIFDVTMVSVQ